MIREACNIYPMQTRWAQGFTIGFALGVVLSIML